MEASSKTTIGFITSVPFDEIRYTINQSIGLDVGNTSVYYAIIKQYCEGPSLACNTSTNMSEPTYPVSIEGAHTGITGSVCASCFVLNANNVIDANTTNYAEIVLTAGTDVTGSLSVKNQLTDYNSGTFAGFDIVNPNLAGTNLLDVLNITTYLDGNLVESATGVDQLISVNSILLTGEGAQRVGFITTQPFDEVSISIAQTAAVDLGTTEIYGTVFEEFCEGSIYCANTYWLTDPDFPVVIDNANTGITDLSCAACSVQDPGYVIDNDNTNFALIQVPAGAAGSVSLAVLDAVATYPAGSVAGFSIQDVNELLQADLLENLTITTFKDGVEQESATGETLVDFAVLVEWVGAGSGVYNIGFTTTLPFDELKITVDPNVSVINQVRVYGVFIDTRGASLDNEPPVIVCPSAVMAVVDTGECEATIADLGTPVTSDNCRVDTVYNNAPVKFLVGNTMVTWTVADAGGNTATCEQTVTVTSPPVAVNDTVTTSIDTPVNFDALSNDTDCDNNINPATLTELVAPVHGILSIDAGNITYTPPTGFTGTDSLTYQICDDLGACSAAKVYFTIEPENGLPSAENDNFTIAEDSENVSLAVLNDNGNGVDNFGADGPNSGSITLGSHSPVHGSVLIISNGTPNDPTDDVISYTPNPDFNGTDSFSYLITDGNGDSSEAVVTLTIGAETDAVADSENTNEDESVIIDVLANDSFSDPNAEISDVTQGANGTVIINTDNTITYTPNSNFSGTDTFSYTVTTVGGVTETADVTINVNEGVLVANNDDFSGSPVNGYEGGIAGDVTANDTNKENTVDDGAVTISLIDSGGITGATIDDTGNITIPAGTAAGNYTLQYQICDNFSPDNCAVSSVTITVEAASIAATADDFSSTPVNGYQGGIAGDLTANDLLNGQPVNDNDITITLNDNPVGATVDASGELTIPAGTAAGDYTITYTVCEKLNPANCSSSSVTITVEAASIAATADDFSSTPVNGYQGGIAGDLTANDLLNGQPVNDNDITITLNDNPVGATVDASGELTIPAGTAAGDYTITYTVCEKLNPANCSSSSVTITVEAASIAATADDFSSTPVNGYQGGIAGDLTANDLLNGQPVNDNDITITLNDNPVGATVDASGELTIPAGTAAGDYTITYTVCEKLNPANCSSSSVEVTVEAASIAATADDFSSTPVNGYQGRIAGDLTANDLLNGQPVNDNDITITLNDNPVGATVDASGELTIPAGTAAGDYTITYTVCEKLNPANCSSSSVEVTVEAASIAATADDFSSTPVNGYQ